MDTLKIEAVVENEKNSGIVQGGTQEAKENSKIDKIAQEALVNLLVAIMEVKQK